MPIEVAQVIIVLVVIVASVILHELSHGLIAYWLGDRTAKDAGRLTLNPFKHIDPIMSIAVPLVLYLIGAPVFGGAKPVPINERNLKWGVWGMALVAIAGPLTNFFLALLSFLIGQFTGLLDGVGGQLWAFTFVELIVINLGFMIFNLIPIPPLDGSRVLFAIAPDAVRRIMLAMEPYGIFIIYGLIFFFGGVFGHLMTTCTTGILNFFFWLTGG